MRVCSCMCAHTPYTNKFIKTRGPVSKSCSANAFWCRCRAWCARMVSVAPLASTWLRVAVAASALLRSSVSGSLVRLQLEGRVNYYVSFGKEPFKTSTVSTSCTNETRWCCLARQGNLSTFLLQRKGCLGQLQLQGRVNYYVSCGKEPFKGLSSPSSVLRIAPFHHDCDSIYQVATMSRLLEIVGFFCRISSLQEGAVAKETYDFKEPTNRSHPIVARRIESLLEEGPTKPHQMDSPLVEMPRTFRRRALIEKSSTSNIWLTFMFKCFSLM